MGIRFNCPNGHRLNVKTALAGRRAICPECGAKLVVPGVATGVANESAMSSAIGLPIAMPSGIGAQAAVPAAEVAPPVTRSGAVWYVRPRGGGQFGPATDEVFRGWILEGRVDDDARVWREGWNDWKLARDAGAVLPAPLTPIPDVAAPAIAASTVGRAPKLRVGPPADDADDADLSAGGDGAMMPGSQYLASRRRANKLQMTVALVMMVAIVVLAVVLVWVLMRSGSPAPATGVSLGTELAERVAAAYVAGDAGMSGFLA